jgi:hypothetical protein
LREGSEYNGCFCVDEEDDARIVGGIDIYRKDK